MTPEIEEAVAELQAVLREQESRRAEYDQCGTAHTEAGERLMALDGPVREAYERFHASLSSSRVLIARTR